MLEAFLNTLSQKENLVFVGTTSMKIQGIDIVPQDIDIVVTDLVGLENYVEYTTDSKFSTSGKRAFIKGEIDIDIFIEDTLPEYVIIDGKKAVTFFYMKKLYNVLLNIVDDYLKNDLTEKLNLLQ